MTVPHRDIEKADPRDFTYNVRSAMKGALGMGLLSLKRLHGGGLGGEAPSLGTLEDMFR